MNNEQWAWLLATVNCRWLIAGRPAPPEASIGQSADERDQVHTPGRPGGPGGDQDSRFTVYLLSGEGVASLRAEDPVKEVDIGVSEALPAFPASQERDDGL